MWDLLLENCQCSGSSSNSVLLYLCYSTNESYSHIIRSPPTPNLENNSVFKFFKKNPPLLLSRWQKPRNSVILLVILRHLNPLNFIQIVRISNSRRVLPIIVVFK
jgi:hypothetical protein